MDLLQRSEIYNSKADYSGAESSLFGDAGWGVTGVPGHAPFYFNDYCSFVIVVYLKDGVKKLW